MTLTTLRARLRALLNRRRLRQELEEEFAFHLDAEAEHQRSLGLTQAAAERAALIAFGGTTRFREETHAARGVAGLEACGRDIRLALRRLARAPLFSAGVIGTLAIALGAAAGIGSLVHQVLLKPLPYPEPDRLVRLAAHTPGLNLTGDQLSGGTYVHLLESARMFSELGGYIINEGFTVTDDVPERVAGAIVTPSLLRLLAPTPVAGRLFREEDARADTTAVILSHAFWQRRFGGDPGIVGRLISINRTPRNVLGVLGPATEPPWDQVALYLPNEIRATSASLGTRYLTVIGRLAPGATLEAARQELSHLATTLPDRFPDLTAQAAREAGFQLSAESLHDATIAPVRGELRLLALMVALLLLIATANVVTLALLRAERLRGEVATSRALGAQSGAIRRRFVIEGGVLAIGAGAFALPVGAVSAATRFGFTSAEIPRLHGLGMTPGLAAAILLAALGIGAALGALAAIRADPGLAAAGWRDDGRSTRGRRWRRAQATLVTLQVALAMTLMVGAGLLGASLVKLRRVDLGFDPTGRISFSLFVPGNPYRTWERVNGFHARVQEGLRAIPGVSAAGVAMQFPSTPHLLYVHPRLTAARPDGRMAEARVTLNIVSPTFFEVMGIPMRQGRAFVPGELGAAPHPVVLSATLARDLFGTENPLGREVRLPPSWGTPAYRVVGVSGDTYAERVTDGPLRTLYFPLLPEAPMGGDAPEIPAGVTFVLRSSLPLDRIAPEVRAVVRAIDPRVPIWGLRTLDAMVAETMARTRLVMLLLAVAAVATLSLSALGLYSVVAYTVASRSREFAVRLALGAAPTVVTRLVLREGTILALAGIALGIGFSLAGVRVLRNVLYEVSATDPRLYLAGTLVVLLTAMIATLIPARRAGAADPAGTLRGE